MSTKTDEPAADASEARTAGRGGIAIAIAKISFVLLGLVQQLVFPRVLDEAGYGSVSRMLAIVSVVNNVIVASSIQGVSRMVAGAKPGEEDAAFRTTLTVHVVIALTASIVFAALAGFIAGWVGAPHATTPIRVAGGVILCYGVYAPMVGALNGKKRFTVQASLDILYGVARTIAMTVGAWAFARVLHLDGATGAATGFVLAAAFIIPVAVRKSGTGSNGSSALSRGAYVAFIGPLIVAQIGLNLLLQTDFFLMSRAVGAGALARGLSLDEADKLVGYYRSAQLFGFLPYQLLMSVQFVLFPLLAKASSEDDAEGVKRLTRSGVRLAFILTGLIAGTIASLGPQLLSFAFPANIAEKGASFVRIYVLGLASLAILGVASAALTSLRRERWAVLLTWAAVALVGGAILVLQPADAFGLPLLQRTAAATAVAMTLAAILGAVLLWRAAGAFVAPLTMARVFVATAVTVGLGLLVPSPSRGIVAKLIGPGVAPVMAVVYLGVLFALRELGAADVDLVKRVLRRGKQG
ncbi:MAG: lipopolysaccharide biosynthesis protein [Polyangiaceae bacterium]